MGDKPPVKPELDAGALEASIDLALPYAKPTPKKRGRAKKAA